MKAVLGLMVSLVVVYIAFMFGRYNGNEERQKPVSTPTSAAMNTNPPTAAEAIILEGIESALEFKDPEKPLFLFGVVVDGEQATGTEERLAWLAVNHVALLRGAIWPQRTCKETLSVFGERLRAAPASVHLLVTSYAHISPCRQFFSLLDDTAPLLDGVRAENAAVLLLFEDEAQAKNDMQQRWLHRMSLIRTTASSSVVS